MAIIVQHAVENGVCSAQYPRCADQRPGFRDVLTRDLASILVSDKNKREQLLQEK